jgi:hypothetical protein
MAPVGLLRRLRRSFTAGCRLGWLGVRGSSALTLFVQEAAAQEQPQRAIKGPLLQPIPRAVSRRALPRGARAGHSGVRLGAWMGCGRGAGGGGGWGSGPGVRWSDGFGGEGSQRGRRRSRRGGALSRPSRTRRA